MKTGPGSPPTQSGDPSSIPAQGDVTGQGCRRSCSGLVVPGLGFPPTQSPVMMSATAAWVTHVSQPPYQLFYNTSTCLHSLVQHAACSTAAALK